MNNNEILSELYFDPKHPASYAGINKLYKYAKLRNNDITLADVKQWLSKQFVYTLHRPARRHFPRNRIIVSYIDQQWEMDLLDMQKYANDNDRYKYILVAIDCFSKYAFAEPLKTKTGLEILSAFKKIIKKRKPHKIRTDKGGEFDNKYFKAYCKNNDIIHFTTQNVGFKCAIVERFNRTLHEKIQKHQASTFTRRFIKALPDIIDSYNNSYHRSIKFVPANVTKKYEPLIFKNLYGTNSLKQLYGRNKTPKFKVGDSVRRIYDLKIMDKSYYPLWSDIVYKIDKVYHDRKIPQYTIRLDDNKLKRRFYPEELQKVIVDENTLWQVEEILEYRTLNRQQQAYVKWKGYPAQYNSWIPMDHIQNP